MSQLEISTTPAGSTATLRLTGRLDATTAGVLAAAIPADAGQNGLAERFIGTIVQRARTLLLHAMSKWPSVITEDFWPFAIRYMVMFHNSTIRRDKPSSPYELFTGQQPTWSLADFCVFGCPS